ncbi:MAG: PepSY domain-containing protein [Rhizobiales bacterium]|nr:PepSY domain-containing protein [Rhizobacter sp.]
MTRHLLIALLTLAAATGASAQEHAEKCEPISKEEWKPQAELERKLVNQGWKISRVKITNGCYEVYGKNAIGRNVELFFHPKTFELVTAPK